MQGYGREERYSGIRSSSSAERFWRGRRFAVRENENDEDPAKSASLLFCEPREETCSKFRELICLRKIPKIVFKTYFYCVFKRTGRKQSNRRWGELVWMELINKKAPVSLQT